MEKRFVSVCGPSVKLGSGQTLRDTHIVGQDVSYGRVLFTSNVLLEVEGHGVQIIGNYFEGGTVAVSLGQ